MPMKKFNEGEEGSYQEKRVYEEDWGTAKGKHVREQERKVAGTETSKVMRQDKSNEGPRQVENEGARKNRE